MAYVKTKTLDSSPIEFVRPHAAAALIDQGKTLILIIRHGQTDWNIERRLQGREDVPLNDTGRAQARELSDLLIRVRNCGIGIQGIYTSPLKRAKETADYLASTLHMENPIPVAGLIEREYGKLSGLTLEERKERLSPEELRNPGMETPYEASRRFLRALDDIVSLSGSKTSVAVTHGGNINALYLHLTDGRVGTGKSLCVNCGISLVAAGKGRTVPLAFSLTGDIAVEYLHHLKRYRSNM